MRDFKRLDSGYTVVELLAVLTIVGILMSIAIPRVALLLDRIAVDSAASDVHASLSLARSLALAGGVPVAVEVDSLSGVVRIRRGEESLQSRNVGQAHQVRLVPTRDSLTYDPRGLGRGAANLSIVIRRGAAVETVFISRLGRVR
jgi:prepilin-type N-terminal cleavage/methylation domain-containing protein